LSHSSSSGITTFSSERLDTMSLTTVLPFVSSLSTESVTLPAADKTDLVYESVSVDSKTGRITAIYTLSGADTGYPSTVTVNVDPPGPDVKSRYCSITFRTWTKTTSSLVDTIDRRAVQASVSFVIDGSAPLVLSDLMALLGTAFSYTYLSVSSGTRDTTWMAKILAGSPIIK